MDVDRNSNGFIALDNSIHTTTNEVNYPVEKCEEFSKEDDDRPQDVHPSKIISQERAIQKA